MDDSVMPWIFVVIVIIVAYVFMTYKHSNYPVAYVKSDYDDQMYLVRNLPDKMEAANRLARVREKLVRLRTSLEQTHKDKPFVKQILKNSIF
jgi:hypothetical protein